MKFIGIIPARYGSTRLIGKPLISLLGKTMIQRVYEQATKVLKNNVYVATDDERIIQTVKKFGGNAIMTSISHTTGTNRCMEAYEKINKKFDVIINIQGDEPLLPPEQLKELMICSQKPNVEIATLLTKVKNPKDLENENEVFVTFTKNKKALYFSRAVIPFLKGIPKEQWIQKQDFFKHVGLYAYTPSALKDFSTMTPTSLEKTESLEQNRWLENGRNIHLTFTEHESYSVDTKQDVEKVLHILQQKIY